MMPTGVKKLFTLSGVVTREEQPWQEEARTNTKMLIGHRLPYYRQAFDSARYRLLLHYYCDYGRMANVFVDSLHT